MLLLLYLKVLQHNIRYIEPYRMKHVWYFRIYFVNPVFSCFTPCWPNLATSGLYQLYVTWIVFPSHILAHSLTPLPFREG